MYSSSPSVFLLLSCSSKDEEERLVVVEVALLAVHPHSDRNLCSYTIVQKIVYLQYNIATRNNIEENPPILQ